MCQERFEFPFSIFEYIGQPWNSEPKLWSYGTEVHAFSSLLLSELHVPQLQSRHKGIVAWAHGELGQLNRCRCQREWGHSLAVLRRLIQSHAPPTSMAKNTQSETANTFTKSNPINEYMWRYLLLINLVKRRCRRRITLYSLRFCKQVQSTKTSFKNNLILLSQTYWFLVLHHV